MIPLFAKKQPLDSVTTKLPLFALLVIAIAFSTSIAFSAEQTEKKTAQQKAIDYLSKHIPRWKPQQKCFSCHHNGDAARAMFLAKRKGFRIPDNVLEGTKTWLKKPSEWKNNGGGKGPQSDKKLAAIQFANGLRWMYESSDRPKILRPALDDAAKLILTHQDKNGSWKVDSDSLVGSPVTYGRTLATAICRNILITANAKKFRSEIQNANKWLERQKPKNVYNAAAWLFSLQQPVNTSQRETIKHCLEIVKKGVDHSGGWGPYTNSQPEVYDTAIVILGLQKLKANDETKKLIANGKAYLLKTQNADGSWPETTRPSGNESYQNRISTTAWALIALLETKRK